MAAIWGRLRSNPDRCVPAKPPAQGGANHKGAVTGNAPVNQTPTAKKPAASLVKHRTVATKNRRTVSPRVSRMRQAFVASASLRPMAQQLLQDRSLPAYAGVDAYARIHAKEDAGALA